MRDRCDRFDRDWSRFRDDSTVARIAASPGVHRLPSDAPALLDLYRRLYDATDGAVSPLVGRALEQWGYDAAYRLTPESRIAPVPRWEDAIRLEGDGLETMTPVVLDVGAAGKGYLVDLVAELLEGRGVREYTIDASGDIRHRGDAPLRIALEHPRDPSRAVGVAELRDGSLCASATGRRAWPGAHHILDAVTGRPVDDVIATWVVAASTAVADGVATALFVADADRMARLGAEFEFEWVRMRARGLEASPGFAGEVFAR